MYKNLLLMAMAIPLLSSCDKLEELAEDVAGAALTCGAACENIQSCDGQVSPPTMDLGFGDVDLGVEAPSLVDCAVNCSSDSRVTLGYSDCQIECIESESCGNINSCWDVTSDVYASYCPVEDKPVEPAPVPEGEPEPEIAEGTTSGSEEADGIIENPAVEESVEASGTDIFFGSDPFDISGKWLAVGEIDDARNARPIGNPINTDLCFHSLDTSDPANPQISYCERGTPPQDTAPITGSGDNWSIFLEFPGTGSIIFSGTVNEDGESMNEVDALVTYYHGLDIWEHSFTDWDRSEESCTCN
jgi:hypothetical protein